MVSTESVMVSTEFSIILTDFSIGADEKPLKIFSINLKNIENGFFSDDELDVVLDFGRIFTTLFVSMSLQASLPALSNPWYEPDGQF